MRIIVKEAGVEYDKKDAPTISTPEAVIEECQEFLDSDTEVFAVLCLNSKNKMISSNIISCGSVDSTISPPREIFRTAIMKNACKIILVHNHPTGETTPSIEDISITKKLIECGKTLEINVLDHIIIGSQGGFTSIRNTGMVAFA